MINVAAIRMQQFGVQFYQASLTASDIDKLVRFEVLSYGEQAHRRCAAAQAGARAPSKVNWDLLERRIAVEREGLPAPDHPQEDRRAGAVLRAVPPGARPAVDSRRGHHLVRRAAELRAGRRAGSSLGMLKVPEREGILRAIDGQHRLLALHADIEHFGDEAFTRAGRHLRPAARRPRRPDVRHDQREAHAAEPVAPRVAVGPPALPRREPGRGARRRPRAQRARGLAAARRDQAARRRQRPRGAGAARAGAEEAVRDRGVRRRPEGSTSSATRRSASS